MSDFNEKAKNNIPIILQSKEYNDKLEKILIPTESVKDKSAVNNLIKRFSRLLIEVCEKTGMKYKCKNNSVKTTSHNWFDQECQTEKENLRSIGKKLCKNPNNEHLRKQLQMTKKYFKKLCRRKKNQFFESTLSKTNSKDSKQLWKVLKRLFPLSKY